ncbi:hypothetical protein FOCC_FOCC010861 [Frankliniella occidentalis]|uniref:Uncharacterized protein LOC113202033 n=1 Tax=Frankliniella occidentalis TaxID=133901 RepID=A0A6J1RY49_FRAOC|nr:uncharacterized protein LOC113202033 [Frankliniella occidentalis]KAE8743536.1 hypothetical protein FOCC_FOCC010861 [Frankliniella occidentalis]
MLRLTLVAALAVVALSGSAFAGFEGQTQNKFIVTYNVVPDVFGLFAFYTMPRTLREAKDLHFDWASERNPADNNTDLYCRKGDHRVCVLFDKAGSVAGIQLSVEAKELDNSGAPVDVLAIPEWRRNMIKSKEVYSNTAFFVSKAIIDAGGRDIEEDTLTAPDGLYILQTDTNGVETARLHVSNDQSDAEAAGFNEQSCFIGMGKHYFQSLTKESVCENHRPYFTLYGPKSKKLTGFGFTQYGKPSQGRGWFEAPPALAAKTIAPNSPACMTEWLKEYGLFTMHVFFVARPYLTTC